MNLPASSHPPSKKRRLWAFKIVLVLLGIAGGLGIGEFALRYITKGSQFENLEDLRSKMGGGSKAATSGKVTLGQMIEPHPSDEIIYRLKPGTEVVFQGVPVKINSRGLRDDEISLEKPPNEYRIVLLGDSFAFGWGVEKKDSFADVMERELDRREPARRHQVVNFGVPGYSTFQEAAVFKEYGLAYQPDAVLVFFVENDFGLPFFVRDLSGGQGLVNASHVASLIKQMADPAVGQQKLKEMKLDANTALLDLSTFCHEHHLPLSLAINPGKTWDKDRRRLGALNKDPSIRFIDLRAPMLAAIERDSIDPATLTLPTDPHPSPLKHRLMGEDLARIWTSLDSPAGPRSK